MRRLLLVVPATLWLSSAWAEQACTAGDAERLPGLIDLLDSPLAAGDPIAYRARTELLRTQAEALACPGPNPVPALFRTFLRSRYGSPDTSVGGLLSPLPEDPDLFEGALEALRHQPHERLQDGAREGLGAGMSELVWSRMRHDWVRPATAGLLAADRRWVEDWAAPATATGPLDELLLLLDHDPEATLIAMTTEGGSLVHQVVAPLQDMLLAAIINDAHTRPAVLRALAGVATDSGMGGHSTATALARISTPDAGTRSAVEHALQQLGAPQAWRPIQRPAVPPGQVPNLSLKERPDLEPSQVVLRPQGPSFAQTPGVGKLIAGLLMVLLAGLAGARMRRARALSGLIVAAGMLSAADGLAGWLGASVGTGSLPLFSFIAQSEISPRPVPGHPDKVWLGGGSMRLSVVDKTPAVDHRIAVLGASTVHGSHYVADHAFPAQLGQKLPDVEVLNLGIGGATSAGVASAGRTALELGAELLVIAYGHNEAAQFTRLALYKHTSAQWLAMRLWLAESPLYTALAKRLVADRAAAPPDDLYRSEPPSRAEIEQLIQLAVRHFRHQIGGLIAEAQAREVAVVLVIPPTNLRFAHLEAFASPGRGDAEDLDRLRREAEAAAQAGDAVLARALLQQAIDHSASPRELITPIRDEVIRLGDVHGVPVVDGHAWLTAFASDGVSPSGLFWDDVHPSQQGHAHLAEVLAPVIQEELKP